MKSSFLLAYLCDYEVGSGLNTDQASPRGKDVSSPGPGRHAGHAANKILGKLFHEQRQRTGRGDKLVSGTYILSSFRDTIVEFVC